MHSSQYRASLGGLGCDTCDSLSVGTTACYFKADSVCEWESWLKWKPACAMQTTWTWPAGEESCREAVTRSVPSRQNPFLPAGKPPQGSRANGETSLYNVKPLEGLLTLLACGSSSFAFEQDEKKKKKREKEREKERKKNRERNGHIPRSLHLPGKWHLPVRWEAALIGYLAPGTNTAIKKPNTSQNACRYAPMMKLLQTELRVRAGCGLLLPASLLTKFGGCFPGELLF